MARRSGLRTRSAGVVAGLAMCVALCSCSHSGTKSANGSASPTDQPTSSAGTSAGTGSAAATSSVPSPPLSTVPTLPGTTEPPTPLKSTATFGGGVSVHVTNIDYGSVTGSGPGVVSGQPAVTFTLQITNDSPATIKIDTVQVNVTYGSNDTPAVPSNAQSTQAFSGSLAAGKSATGTYAFAIPVPEQNDVSMTVWYNQGQPTVVLTGSAH